MGAAFVYQKNEKKLFVSHTQHPSRVRHLFWGAIEWTCNFTVYNEWMKQCESVCRRIQIRFQCFVSVLQKRHIGESCGLATLVCALLSMSTMLGDCHSARRAFAGRQRAEGCVCVSLVQACAHTQFLSCIHSLCVCAIPIAMCVWCCVRKRCSRIGFAAAIFFLFRRTVSSTKDRAADAKNKIIANEKKN